MFRSLRTHLNPASLIATVALFAALGGVSYAAATIDGKDIQNGTVTGKKLKNGSITGAKVKADSLGGPKIKESTLGQVPTAVKADSATSADSATTAKTAVDAQNAVNAQSAVSAQSAVNAENAAAVGPNGVGSAAIQGGAVRASKLSGAVRRVNTVSIPATGSSLVTMSCEAGERILSGGGFWAGDAGSVAAQIHTVHSFPTTTNGWSTRAYNGTAAAREFSTYVLCLTN
jgi:hypothetical protein